MACKCTPDGSVGGGGSRGTTGVAVGKIGSSLSEDDWVRAAGIIGCEVEALKAVASVETRGSGFFSDGQPQILFERHIFWRQLEKEGINPRQYSKGNEDILNAKSGGYIGGVKEYDRLNRAMMIDGGSDACKEAALRSASWGLFQIMGFNYKNAGCSSAQEMREKAKISEYEQLAFGCNFIKNSPNIRRALISKDFTTFARLYNGPGYAKNKYDVKMRNYYNALKGQK